MSDVSVKDRYSSLPSLCLFVFTSSDVSPGVITRLFSFCCLSFFPFFFILPQELRLLAPAWSFSSPHTHTHTPTYTLCYLTGCNVAPELWLVQSGTHVSISGCGTILSSVSCKCGFPAGDAGNRQRTNGADLQRQRTAIISLGNKKKMTPAPSCSFVFCIN